MLYAGIGVGGLVILVAAGLYFRERSRSRQFLSTTNWVKLMRKNDARAEAAKMRRAAKHRPHA